MAETDAQAPESPELESLKAALTNTVNRRIREAMQAREGSGIEQVWAEDSDQYDGVDDLNRPGKGYSDSSNTPSAHQKNARSKVYLNITKPKTDIAVARVQEMLVPNDDKPWSIEPTPIPDLMEAVDTKSQEMLTLADGTQASAEQVARVAMDKAAAASEKAAEWIEDQFVEGSVYAQMRRVIRDAGRLGTGILKGPFPVARESRKWHIRQGVATLAVDIKTSPTSKKIDVRDFFPDPACGESIHNGSYVVERDYSTSRQLRALARVANQDGTPAYDQAAISEALREGPRSRARDANRQDDKPGDTQTESDVFELFYYYGDIEPETLIDMGVPGEQLGDQDVYLATVPAIVTMLNDRPIKCAINPLESGEFPFDVFPWEPVEGQIWGRGVPRKMAVAQRILVASVRALMENAGLSAGPQIGISEGAIKPVDGNYAITGRKLWKFTPTDLITKIQDAMHVWEIPSAQKELAEIIAFALKMADELTNLPMLLQGQQGTAPQLLGGMQMLMQNASAPLRVIAKQFDDYLISPHLNRYYDWCMQSGPPEAKGDMRIQARGSTALLQREVAREFLVQAVGLSQRPGSRINPDKLDAELFKANGASMKAIEYTDAEWKQLQEAKAQQPAPQDPRIEAANIRAKSEEAQIAARAAEHQQKMGFDAQQAELDRALDEFVAQMEFRVQAMELANKQSMGMADIKALMAQEVIKSRDKRQLFAAEQALKLNPANPTNQGI